MVTELPERGNDDPIKYEIYSEEYKYDLFLQFNLHDSLMDSEY